MDEFKKELREKINWFINLRFVAVVGVFAVVSGAKYILNIELPVFYLYLGNTILLLYNILFFLYNRKVINKEVKFENLNIFANLQISIDIIMLVYFIYFSGGIENPFIFYFIFHIIIASMLLSNLAAYLQATLAIVLLGYITIFEYYRTIPHYHLTAFISTQYCLSPYYLLGIFFVFITTLYITVYFATNIVNKLREREDELSLANQKLQEESKLKSRYVGMVSHDIQSSLATIQNSLKVVLDGFTGEVSEKAQEMILRAEQRSLYVLNFVKDLLDLSKIKTGKDLEKKPIQLKEIVEKVVEDVRKRAEEKRLILNVANSTANSTVYANPDGIEQVLVNLLTNAMKYTPWGGKITVSVQSSTSNDSILVSVEDTGIGIPQEEQDEIFDEFYRAKSAQKFVKDGTGLGLSIVKEIIKAHNGEIYVESEVGKGSKFIVSLPKREK